MRPSMLHSTMPTAAARPAPKAQSGLWKAWQSAGPDRGRPLVRTSRPEPPASDPRRTRSACNGKKRHPSLRPSHGQRPDAQTTDARDTTAPERRSRGRSQTLFYNTHRPHSALSGRTPDETYRGVLPTLLPRDSRATASELKAALPEPGISLSSPPTCPNRWGHLSSRGRTGDLSRARTFDLHGHGIAYRPRGPG